MINSSFLKNSFVIDGNIKLNQNRLVMESELYHENSKLHPHDIRPWLYKKKEPGLIHIKIKNFLKRSSKSYKLYPSALQIELPRVSRNVSSVDLWGTMYSRRSLRNYSSKKMQLEDIGIVLAYSYGKTGKWDFEDYSVNLRAVPSAGALYPLNIYALVCGIDGLEQGLYHYNVRDHSLEFLQQGDFLEQLIPAIQPDSNEWLLQAKLVLFVSATFSRNQMKYGNRGYRGVLLDAGHLSQNILLAATGLNLAACPIVGCMDDQINDFLEIDGVEESVLYAIAVGCPVA